MDIKRIKIKGEDVTVEYREAVSDHVKTTKDQGEKAPSPGFMQAFEALKPFVGKLVELPEEWIDEAVITGVTFAEKDDTAGVVITATRACALTNGPVNIATPVYWLDDDLTTDFCDGLRSAVDEVKSEAEAYLCGEVAQLSIPSDDDADPVPEFDDEETTVEDAEPVGA